MSLEGAEQRPSRAWIWEGNRFRCMNCRRAQGERALASGDNRQCPLKPPGSQLPIPHAGDAKYD